MWPLHAPKIIKAQASCRVANMKTGTATYGSFLFGGEEVSNSRCANRLTRLRKRLLQLWKAGLTKELVVVISVTVY